VSEAIRRIEADGWYFVAQKGSHRQYKHPTKRGRVTTGSTVEETLANMRQAIVFHLEGLAEDQKPIPASSIIAAQLLFFDTPEPAVK
jgi:predicted RNA binding protein YcfA (HicA-like mRNA interferase family)